MHSNRSWNSGVCWCIVQSCWIIISIIQWIAYDSHRPFFILLSLPSNYFYFLSSSHAISLRISFVRNPIQFISIFAFVPISFRTQLKSVLSRSMQRRMFNWTKNVAPKNNLQRRKKKKENESWKRIRSLLNGSNIQSLFQLANARLSKTRKMQFPKWNSIVLLYKFNLCSQCNDKHSVFGILYLKCNFLNENNQFGLVKIESEKLLSNQYRISIN